VGAANFYAGMSAFEAAATAAAVEIMRDLRLATLQQAVQADAMLVLGDDPALVAPRLALALRQAATRPPAGLLAARGIPAWDDAAAKNAASGLGAPCILATTAAGWLDAAATSIIRQSAETVTPFAVAISEQIRGATPAGPVAATLLAAKSPLVVAGGDAATLLASANIVLALRRAGVMAQLSLLLPEANSAGLALLDSRPLTAAVAAARGNAVIVLERDILRESAGAAIFSGAHSVTVLDHIETPSIKQADLALAIGSFADSDGTFINQEGRVQRYYKAIFGADDPPQDWALLRDAGVAAGRLELGRWQTHGALLAAMAETVPALAIASPETDRARPATLPHRYSGRTAANAHLDVREAMPWQHEDSPLGTTMEGPPVHLQSGLVPVVWSPGWNSGQAVHKFQDQSALEVFLFQDLPERRDDFEIPAAVFADDRVLGSDELSALSPAIIARRGAA
jgi:NADH-quinone oxidoreductase subunit G